MFAVDNNDLAKNPYQTMTISGQILDAFGFHVLMYHFKFDEMVCLQTHSSKNTPHRWNWFCNENESLLQTVPEPNPRSVKWFERIDWINDKMAVINFQSLEDPVERLSLFISLKIPEVIGYEERCW